ncbi:hypothetical protein AGMMS49975_03310 [Clostridia bacterium]|nr:hypothetical protein AGMMS49975_03310 [Clostridia bacterium]GHU75366.1 hypothetical protein FACS1894188_06060 [Clostridia bacterium]
MSDHTYNSSLLIAYMALIDKIKIRKSSTTPEQYNSLIDLAEDYREWVMIATESQNVPPTPEKI